MKNRGAGASCANFWFFQRKSQNTVYFHDEAPVKDMKFILRVRLLIELKLITNVCINDSSKSGSMFNEPRSFEKL